MILIANWKMNLGVGQSKSLANSLLTKFSDADKNIVVCPDFTMLDRVSSILSKSQIKIGAQNVFWKEFGSYTGEVCYKLLEDLGCEYVIIGHSERRENLGENNEIINKKAKIIIEESNLTPIICIGENLQDRESGNYKQFLKDQIELALNGIDIKQKKVIIAYEPIWAIGAGKPIDAYDAENIHKMIYLTLEGVFGEKKVKNNFKIIYGGSVKSSNIKSFIGLEKVDGFLVGGASLDAEEFYKMSQII